MLNYTSGKSFRVQGRGIIHLVNDPERKIKVGEEIILDKEIFEVRKIELSGNQPEVGLIGKFIKEKILKASNVYKIRWDENNLIIYFNNGNTYQYFDVPERLSVGLSEAVSPGSFLHREIKGNYRYARID